MVLFGKTKVGVSVFCLVGSSMIALAWVYGWMDVCCYVQ